MSFSSPIQLFGTADERRSTQMKRLLRVVPIRVHLRSSTVPLYSKTKRPPRRRAAHSSEPEPVAKRVTYPVFLRIGAVRAARMAPCLCSSMGRLLRVAQVHPGRSGFEKVDLIEVDVHGRLLAHRQALGRLNASDHVIGQVGAHVQV